MKARNNKRQSTGGRIMRVQERDVVAVVNKSNIDVQFNDCEPPFRLNKFAAGNISAKTERLNCVQFYTRKSADKALLDIGPDALDFFSEKDGIYLLETARSMGSFKAAYEKLRSGGKIADLSKSPSEVVARGLVVRALLKTGLQEGDIDQSLGVTELRAMHRDRVAGRQNITLMRLDTPDEAAEAPSGGRVRPSATIGMQAALTMKIEALGGVPHPGASVEKLQDQLDELERNTAQAV